MKIYLAINACAHFALAATVYTQNIILQQFNFQYFANFMNNIFNIWDKIYLLFIFKQKWAIIKILRNERECIYKWNSTSAKILKKVIASTAAKYEGITLIEYELYQGWDTNKICVLIKPLVFKLILSKGN